MIEETKETEGIEEGGETKKEAEKLAGQFLETEEGKKIAEDILKPNTEERLEKLESILGEAEKWGFKKQPKKDEEQKVDDFMTDAGFVGLLQFYDIAGIRGQSQEELSRVGLIYDYLKSVSPDDILEGARKLHSQVGSPIKIEDKLAYSFGWVHSELSKNPKIKEKLDKIYRKETSELIEKVQKGTNPEDGVKLVEKFLELDQRPKETEENKEIKEEVK